ncbi:MAG: hemolysin family protein [Spirochaetaceae bacterium]|jgi:putative hemolysin|nr:hemolysin family protein [Spirochaetaceae bacterium]
MVRQLLLQLILILFNAFFASAEIALISVKDAKLELMAAGGDRRAKKLLSLTKQPARFLATIQVGITLAGFLGSAFAADNFAEKLMGVFAAMNIPIPLATRRTVAVVVITIILSFFTLVLGELVPKRIAMKKAEKLAFLMAGVIFAISKIFSPVIWLLTKSTNALLLLFRIDPNAEEETVTEEEIRMMVDAGSERGTIDAGEQELIHNVFEFDNRSAGEVMTHRTSAIMLQLKDSDADWEKIITDMRHSFYPVTGETADDIRGVLSAQDYFRLKERDRETVLARAVHPPNFVPETAKADVVFKNMKRSRNRFAVVLDEYGGMSGIITINDLLEAIVGDFDDDVSVHPLIEQLEDGVWRINGKTPLDRAARALKTKLPVEDYDTFGGYVFSLLGEIPENGLKADVNSGELLIHIEEIRERHLETALVRLLRNR